MNAALDTLHERLNAATSREELGNISHSVWTYYLANGHISEADAQRLSEAIHARKPERGLIGAKALVNLNTRAVSRFSPRPCRKRLTGEDRLRRRNRKRMLGSSSAMPDTLRSYYTEGERAVACVVAGECKRHGVCDLSIDEIADRAGVGRTTVQNFQHEGRRLGHIKIRHRPQRGAKSLTNVLTIASPQWLTWIKRAPSAARGLDRVQISENVSTVKSIDLRKKGAWQGTPVDNASIGLTPHTLVP